MARPGLRDEMYFAAAPQRAEMQAEVKELCERLGLCIGCRSRFRAPGHSCCQRCLDRMVDYDTRGRSSNALDLMAGGLDNG